MPPPKGLISNQIFILKQISITQMLMVPDPDPADTISDLLRDPRKLPAADQMCGVDGANGLPALYNHAKCVQQGQVPQVPDPNIEVIPGGFKQGLVLANDTVR